MSSKAESSKSSKSKPGPRSKNQIIKEGWGSRPNFQYSYGLKMEPDDIEEGNNILDALVQQEREDWEAEQTEQKSHKGKK